MSTAIDRRPDNVALFNGATPDDIITAASDVATRFSDIVKRQRMYKRIGDRDHILIEAWQTIGTLTGVFAVEAGGVRELPWPDIEGLVWVAEEPPLSGREPRNRDSEEWQAWKQADELRKRYEHHQAIEHAHALGKAWGYVAAFRAEKDGREIGWGEGRVDRSERTWAGRDDYALSSMAQTRGQSRALGAPLRFIVKLSGYEPTLPDDMPEERAPAEASVPPPPEPYMVGDREIKVRWDQKLGAVTDDDEQLGVATRAIGVIDPNVDAADFMVQMGKFFDGVPMACVTMLRGLANFIGDARAAQPDKPQEGDHA